MSKLEDLLKMPRDWRKWEHNWKRLTEGDTLFQALHEAVRSESVGEASKWTEEWKVFVDSSEPEDEKEKRRRKWLAVRKMVWCAEQASTQASFYQTEIDRVCFAIKDLPQFIGEDKEWAWICIRTFLSMVTRKVDVPVVLLEPKEGDKREKGSLAILRLEVIEREAGQIAHHPAHIFCTDADVYFRSTIEDAWFSVSNLLKKEKKECKGVLYDARWQLLHDGRPLSMPKGRSASGAAAMGFYHALNGTIPDKGIIVVAQVNQNGMFNDVEGIPEKVRAIVEDGRFDTIVVASEENQYQAKSALRDWQTMAGLNKQDHKEHPCVVMCTPPAINNLVTIRSQLSKDLISYFKKTEEELTGNPLLDRFGRKLDDLRVQLQVVPYDSAKDVEEIRAREHFRETAQSREGEDDTECDKHRYAYRGTQFEEYKESCHLFV